MLRKIRIIILGLVLCIGVVATVHAAPASNATPTMNETQHATDAGNTVCPVSGEPVDKDSKVTYEYKGKVYRFCCPMCIEEFKKDPEKYIKKLEAGEKRTCPHGGK